MKAEEFLSKGQKIMAERAALYGDGSSKERNMAAIVKIFNAATGHNLSTLDGWLFMCALKLSRAGYAAKPDDFIDGMNYFALAGEEAVRHTPKQSSAQEYKPVCICPYYPGQCKIHDQGEQ